MLHAFLCMYKNPSISNTRAEYSGFLLKPINRQLQVWVTYVIKQYQNIDFKVYSKLKEQIFMVFYCFSKPSTACISGTINQPAFMNSFHGFFFFAKCGIKNA